MNTLLICVFISHCVAVVFTIWRLAHTYSQQHAAIKEYVDGQITRHNSKMDAVIDRMAMYGENIQTLKLSINKIIQSQQGMENVTIKAMQEEIDTCKKRLDDHKAAIKRMQQQKKSKEDNVLSEHLQG